MSFAPAELPSRVWRAALSVLKRLPQAGLSRTFGRLADVPLPHPVRPTVLGAFARATGIDVDEAELPLDEYPSIGAFFTRRLAAGARTWPTEPGLCSPVDGVVGEVGRIRAGRLIQAKGRAYMAGNLLGAPDEAARYEGGWFVTLYLGPRHYHRVHAPVSGRIPSARYVPGRLLPVNEPSVAHVERLFARNERLLCHVDSRHGRVTLVAVGAYNVGRISVAFDSTWPTRRAATPTGRDRGAASSGGWPTAATRPSGGRDRRADTIVTNRKNRESVARERHYDLPVELERGDELLAFHLGSTVVLLTEPDRFELTDHCRPGRDVRVGALLAEPKVAR